MNTIVAEKAVIGIMLMKPELQDDAFSSLTYKMFELKALGNIFLLCKDMADKGQRLIRYRLFPNAMTTQKCSPCSALKRFHPYPATTPISTALWTDGESVS